MLRIKSAKAICKENNLPLAFYYQTFSYTKEHPKFRLAFVMDKPVTDEGKRKKIMETLVNLFPQSGHSSHVGVRSDSELDELVRNFDLFGYLKERNGGFRRTESGAVFHNCEICGHHGNLMYVKETNTFYCHSKAVGGSIIDYLIHAE